MDLLRIDLVDILDVSLTDNQRRRLYALELNQRQARAGGLAQRLEESSEWIFLSRAVRGLALIDLSRPSKDSATRGAVLRLSREHGYGSYITWKSYGPEKDPLWVKTNSWNECAAARQPLFELVGEVSGLRHYPFIALRANVKLHELAPTLYLASPHVHARESAEILRPHTGGGGVTEG